MVWSNHGVDPNFNQFSSTINWGVRCRVKEIIHLQVIKRNVISPVSEYDLDLISCGSCGNCGTCGHDGHHCLVISYVCG